jgi:hypothetical protein
MNEPQTFHKLMCSGVGSFSVQWSYWDGIDKAVRWFPSDDPDGDGDDDDSDFSAALGDSFGVYFNVPAAYRFGLWYPISDPAIVFNGKTNAFVPRALKFTFTLYDSMGLVEGGREFTHTVRLE